MVEPVEILWQPAGLSMPGLGAKALVDVTDGDTPNVRMPVRMLSVDTPEVTARSAARAAAIDGEFQELAAWIRQGKAPVSPAYGAFLLPRLETGRAGTLQLDQGERASAFTKGQMEERLTRPDGSRRSLFVRTADDPFDGNGRLLAYVAPSYGTRELAERSRKERATFNLDLIEAGWAAPFVIYPSIPGELDLPLLLEAAVAAVEAKRGIWAEDLALLPYEYRSMERLHAVTKRIVAGQDVAPADRFGWRERYCADMRDRRLRGPEDYPAIPPAYRLWVWPADLQDAIARLNLVPVPRPAGAG